LALPLFAVTLFVSAFLLFLVQPIIGALILPRLGGTPQVWNTCMVFFQAALLAGYAYTHSSSTWLPTRRQILVHCVLLLIPLLVLIVLPVNGPFDITGWIPPPGSNPIPSTLFLLAAVVGIPFFVVATSAPLLQKWFASTGHPSAKDPYFLYAASNLGSMLGLLSYPVIVEPFFRLRSSGFDLATQNWLWTVGYVIMMLLFFACAATVLLSPPSVQLAGSGGARHSSDGHSSPAPQPAPSPAPEPAVASSTAVSSSPKVSAPKSTGIKKGSKQGKHARQQTFAKREVAKPAPSIAHPVAAPATDEVTTARRIRWVALAAVPSSLMLGVTTYMSTDISAIPLFWVLPLTLYLLSFILVFLRWPEPWVGTPHRVVLAIQPVSLLIFVFVMLVHPANLVLAVGFMLAAFFLTALACHGELAADRPPTKHLTEFYLWMSVGGMVGGMFNALIAPIVFTYVIEFSLALVVAGLVLPRTRAGGWADNLLTDMMAKHPGQPQRASSAVRGSLRKPSEAEDHNPIHLTLDIALPIGLFILSILLLSFGTTVQGFLQSLARGMGFGKSSAGTFLTWGYNLIVFLIPLAICFLYAGRPLRFGLGIGAVLLASGIYTWSTDRSLIFADRSYYSVIRVKKSTDEVGTYTQLIHSNINHGMNFTNPPELKRLATTYYHRMSPVGYVMEKACWFHDPKTPVTDPVTRKAIYPYWSDARMPASLVGLTAAPLGVSMLPMGQLVGVWSEPGYATVGLGTGTMAVYAHPYQTMDFYEIDRQIRHLSLPPSGRTAYFTNLEMALKRGVNLHVLMGDARLRMAQPWTPSWEPDHWEKTGGPDSFYMAIIVDAFSSDAIPMHLINKEAFELYFTKLSEKGILCMHTSNRYVDLVRVCGDLATSLGYAWKRGHTEGSTEPGHFSSEWVMIARKPEYLGPDAPRPDMFDPNVAIAPHWAGCVEPKDDNENNPRARYWNDFVYWTPGAHAWTDDFHNMLSVFRPFIRDSQ
jgi:hypothetical protein